MIKECYLVWDDSGYLSCSYNHKVNEKCLLGEGDLE